MKTGSLGHAIVRHRSAAADDVIQASTTDSNVSRSVQTELLQSFVLGSVDGLITTFVVIIGGLAGGVQTSSVVLIGLSSLFADGFSMGVSEYLSVRTTESPLAALRYGVTCFCSFVLFGAIPLTTYVAIPSGSGGYVASVVSFVVSLLVVGLLRAYALRTRCLQSVLEVGGLGAGAGAVAFVIASVTNA